MVAIVIQFSYRQMLIENVLCILSVHAAVDVWSNTIPIVKLSTQTFGPYCFE